MLLALAGAQGWTLAREPLAIARDDRFARLALFAPATGFFQAPGALDEVRATILAWAGTNDTITPPGTSRASRLTFAALRRPDPSLLPVVRTKRSITGGRMRVRSAQRLGVEAHAVRLFASVGGRRDERAALTRVRAPV